MFSHNYFCHFRKLINESYQQNWANKEGKKLTFFGPVGRGDVRGGGGGPARDREERRPTDDPERRQGEDPHHRPSLQRTKHDISS